MAMGGGLYVSSLRHTACMVAVRGLLGHLEDTDTDRLLGLVETEFFSSVTLSILRKITQDHPTELTDDLLVGLAPPHVREITLDGCFKITSLGLCRLLNK